MDAEHHLDSLDEVVVQAFFLFLLTAMRITRQIECVRSGWACVSEREPGRMVTEVGENLSEIPRIRIGVGERQPHLAHGDPLSGADLQQLQPHGGTLRACELRSFMSEATQCVHQHVGERSEVQPQSIGTYRRGAGAIGEQAELLLLDAVLHIAAGAVELFIQPLGRAVMPRQIGHHEARVGAFL